MEHQTRGCDACKQQIIVATLLAARGGPVNLEPEPDRTGEYRLTTQGAKLIARKLTTTEKTTTGWGAKLYRLHNCPKAVPAWRRRRVA